MKKFLRRFAVCTLALCTCFAFVGCGNGDEKKTDAEQFTSLKTAVAKVDSAEDFDGSWTIVSTESNLMSCETENAVFTGELTEEEKTAYKTNMSKYMNGFSTEKEIMSYNKDTNLGYKVEYSSDEANLECTKANIEDFELVQKEEEAYKIYRASVYDEDVYLYVYTADANYLKNYVSDLLEDLEEVIDMVDFETFAEFKAEMIDLMKEEISILGATPKFSVKFSTKKGVSTLTATMKIENASMEVGGVQYANMNATSEIAINFNKDGVLGYSLKSTTSGTMTMAIGEGKTMSFDVSSSSNNSIELERTYDETHCPKFDDETFVKESFEDEGNVYVNVNFVLNEMSYSSTYTKFGEELNLTSINSDLPEGTKWFVDEACTQEFTGTVPSNNITLYAKVTLPEDKAFVIFIYTSLYESLGSDIDEILKNNQVEIVDKNYKLSNDTENYAKVYVNGVEKTLGEDVVLNAGANVIVYVYASND